MILSLASGNSKDCQSLLSQRFFFLSKYSARFRLSFQVFIYFFLGGAAPRPFWKPSPMLYLLHRIMPCSILWDFFFLCFSENPAVTEQAKTKRECWWQGVHWRPQNCGVHATFPQGCMENLRGLFSSTALNRCLLPHFLCNLAAGFKSGIELLRNASEPKTASDLSLLPFPVPIWEQSSYQCSAASAPVPPDPGQQAAPLTCLRGAVLMPSPLRMILFFPLSQNWDNVCSRVCLTSCSVALCLKKSGEKLRQVFGHKLRGQKRN